MPHATSEANQVTFSEFVSVHKPQLESSGIPERYWNTLYEKITQEVFDAGNVFSIFQVQDASEDDEDANYNWRVAVATDDGIDIQDPDHIYLIDHAWTYHVNEAKNQLRELPSLRSRMAAMMDIPTEDKTTEEVVRAVFDNMWRYNQTYSLGSAQMHGSVWYVMDEFGSRIQHSDDPSCRVVPFYCVHQQVAYSVLWPIRDLACEDEVTRNFVEDESDLQMRKCRLLPWKPVVMTQVSFHQEEPNESYFASYIKDESSPPDGSRVPRLPCDRSINVYTDDSASYISLLTDPRFQVVTDESQADIIWVHKRHFDYRALSTSRPDCFISGFPSQDVLLNLDLMAAVSRRMSHSATADDVDMSPPWLPVTYNIVSELHRFVSNYQHRTSKGRDNLWICRPLTSSGRADTHITSNLDYILRLPSTGSKVVCKYIADPVLLYREDISANVKFSISYLLMLENVSPCKVFIDKRFTIQTADKKFDLEDLEDHQKHFTCSSEDTHAKVDSKDFIQQFEQQHPATPWSEIQEKIELLLLCLMRSATNQAPPCGVGHFAQSRGLFTAHIMLAWNSLGEGEKVIQPMLIGIKQKPTAIAAHCAQNQQLVNQVFGRLFLNDDSCDDFISL